MNQIIVHPEGKCVCEWCLLNKEMKETIAAGEIEDLINLIKKLADKLINIGFDNSYYECLLNGSWEGGESILTKVLEKYKNVEKNI